ncbi:unnamed protein product [Colias eurytheme]|nr:unnamed protein product [Colias eurytheme]
MPVQVRCAAVVLQAPIRSFIHSFLFLYSRLQSMLGNVFVEAALSSLEKEAKENVYAVLDPHIQYELMINKHGEPPKYLSLSKPLTHQRTHAFDPQTFKQNEINNNDIMFTTFKQEPPKVRRSDRSSKRSSRNKNNFVSNTNFDIEYSRDPFFGKVRSTEHNDALGNNRLRRSKKNVYEKNNSGRNVNNAPDKLTDIINKEEVRRTSQRKKEYIVDNNINEKERSFEDLKEEPRVQCRNIEDEHMPRPGKVKEIASRFDKHSINNFKYLNIKNERPKPLQSFCDQKYLDHVFPDAVEI